MPTCEICGERLAQSVEGYKNHYKRFHSVSANVIEAVNIIRPKRTTTRSKAQIVHDVEKTFGYAIQPMVQPWHSLGEI